MNNNVDTDISWKYLINSVEVTSSASPTIVKKVIALIKDEAITNVDKVELVIKIIDSLGYYATVSNSRYDDIFRL